MKKFSLLNPYFLLAAFFLSAFSATAEREARHPKQEENRFLFLVDTSAAMRGYSNAVVENVAQLLDADMDGEFRKGDTIGLWTYNATLHPEYPMQVWSKEDKGAISDEIEAYLRARRYETRAHLDKALPSLEKVIKNSQRVTIIWISDGAASMHGTPFDKEINGLQKKYAHELRAAHKPMIVVLAGHDGAIYDYTINYPGLVAIPHTAYPEKVVETNAAPAVAAVLSPPTNAVPKPRVGPSIFISGPPHIVHPTAALPPPAPVTHPVIVPAPQPVVPVPAPIKPAPVVAAPVVASAVIPPPHHEAAPSVPTTVPQEISPSQTQPETATVDKPQLAPTPAAPPEASVAAAHAPERSQLALFIMAFSLLTIAVALVVFLIRRSRGGPSSSLISQSIDRPR